MPRQGLGLAGALGTAAFSGKLEDILAERELARLKAEAVQRQQAQLDIQNRQGQEALDIQRAKLNQPQPTSLDPLMEVTGVLDAEGQPSTQLYDRSGKLIKSLRAVQKPTDKAEKKYQEVPQGVDVPGQNKPVPAVFDAVDAVYRDMTPEHNVIPGARAHKEPYAGVPFVVTQGPGGPGVADKAKKTFTPLTNTATGEEVGKTVPSGTATSVADAEASAQLVKDLASIKKDEWLDPITGRWETLKRDLPFFKEPPPDLAEFMAKSATLENNVIRALTGAALGVQEEARIKRQIPRITDKPSVWEANAQATLENIAMLNRRKLQMAGASPTEQRRSAASSAPTPKTFQAGQTVMYQGKPHKVVSVNEDGTLNLELIVKK